MNLIESAARSINYLTRSVDMRRMAMPYFMTFWHKEGMEYRHNPWDVVEDPGRFSAGVALARYMLGDDETTESERLWKQHLATVWDDDFGLYAVPKGFQFVQTDPDAARYCGSVHTLDADSTCTWDNRSAYMGLVLRGLLFGDEECIRMGRRVIEGYRRWAARDSKREWAYYTCAGMTRDRMPDPDGEPVPGQEMGGILTVLVKDYEWFGDQESLELAVGLANCMMHFAPLGQPWQAHYNMHSYYHYLGGLVRLYAATADRRYLDYAAEHFDYFAPRVTSSFGWVCEWPHAQIMPDSPNTWQGILPAAEGCSTVDFIDTAIMLAKHADPAYWAVAERATRNYLVRAQVHDVSPLPTGRMADDDENSSFTDIPQRLIGNLAGWGDPNDIVNFGNRTGRRVFQACCGAHCPFGLFQAWDNTATRDGDTVSINMAFDRETPFVRTVHTVGNQTGRFEIHLKADARLRVRVPEFAHHDDLSAHVDGSQIEVAAEGCYADLGQLSRGARVTVTHPLALRVVSELVPIYDTTYDVTWLGNDVARIEPPGENLPIFTDLSFPPTDPGATRDVFGI